MLNRNENSNASFSPHLGRRFMFITTVLITIMVIDISLVRTYDVINKQFMSIQDKQFLFSITSIACIVLQFLLLEIIKPRHKGKTKDKVNARLSYKITKYVQCGLGGLVLFIVVQIHTGSYYSTLALLTTILGSYALCIGILVRLLTQILRGVSLKKNRLVSILFAFALVGILINAAIAIIDSSLRLSYRPDEIRPFHAASIDVGKGKFDSLDNAYYISFVFSFVISWIATIVLLGHYSTRIGKLKYCLIALAPIMFFLTQFINFFTWIWSPILNLDPFFQVKVVTWIITLSKPIGGLMLGIVFWSMAGLLGEKTNQVIKNYLVISGLGLLLLFMSNQAILMTISPYPPFGLSTIIVFGFSAYLTMEGIYTSSVIVSRNAQLRKELRRLAKTKLLDSIAYAEMQRELEKRLLESSKNTLIGTENQAELSSPLTDIQAKQYIKDLLDEQKKK